MANLNTGIGTAYDINKPIVTAPGQTLMTQSGQPLERNPEYQPPSIRPDNGQLDSWDTANGVWKSDTVSASGSGAGSNGYGSDAHPVTTSNNNPYGVKLTPFTQKLCEQLGFTVAKGTSATDGGTFCQLENPVQGEKLARALLTSNIYADDTIDQAMKLWSNSGYDGSIVSGTGIAPNEYVKDLSGTQLDTLLAKMKERETGIPAQSNQVQSNTTANGNKVIDPPMVVQPAKRNAITGDSYIVSSKLTDANAVMAARTYSAKTGVPILDDSEVTAVQGIDNAIKNLNTTYDYFKAIAPGHGELGRMWADISMPLNKLVGTQFGSAVKAYQANRDQLFQQINALAGSHPRINSQELITAANALPTMSEFNVDTIQDGEAKLDRTYSILSNALTTFIPGSKGVKGPSSTNNPYIPGSGNTQSTPSGIKYTIK